MSRRDHVPDFLVPVLGLAAGMAAAAAAGALPSLFGGDTAALLASAAGAGVALILGLHGRAADADGRDPAPRAARRLLLLCLFLVAAGFSGSAGRILAWVGAGADASAPGTAVARFMLAILIVGPAAVAAGSAFDLVVRMLPEGPRGGRLLALGGLAASVPVAAVPLAALVTPHESWRYAAWAAGALCAIAAGVLLARRGSPAEHADARPIDPVACAGAAALAFAGAAVAFLAHRLLVPAFANELPGIPLAAASLAASFTVGFAAAAAAARLAATAGATPRLTPLLTALACLAAMTRLADWAALPAGFAAAVETAPDFDTVLRHAIGLALPRIAPAGILLGAAFAVHLGTLPDAAAARRRWTLASGLAGVAGWMAGSGAARLLVAPLGLGNAALAALGGGAALGALALTVGPGQRGLRWGGAVALAAAAGAAAWTAPDGDRMGLLVDRQLRSATSPIRGVQQSWLASDEEDDVLGAAILRRGHARRLLVNGRFDSTNETTAKTHGMLAHLPLCLHGDAKRVLLVGAGTGGALAAAIAHPVEHIDVFDACRVPVRAAVRMGPAAYSAFTDGRVVIRTGDTADLLARASSYDVILLEPSGGWTDRSIAAATREQVELVRDRLAEGGLACAWIPESALTRRGFLDALATWASVFPQVEAWAGHGGDVLLLARRTRTADDFAHVLDAYGDPGVRAACETAWIGTPDTLLSQFLAGDASIRRIARDAIVATRANGALARAEAARRRTEPTVDPVPGLAALRDDVIAAFVNTPREGFAEAISRALRTRELERSAIGLELDARQEDAVAAYREAIDLNPRDGAVRRAFATLRSEQGIAYGVRQDFFAAHQYMREAVETDTTYAQGFANLGLLLFQNDQYDYALACTGQATVLQPDDDLFQLQMGRIWKKRGYYDKALPYYERARELNPLNIEAAIGWLDTKLAMQGDQADLAWGLEFLASLRKLDPGHGDLLYRIDKLSAALQRRQRGEPLEPGDTPGSGPDAAAPEAAGPSAPTADAGGGTP